MQPNSPTADLGKSMTEVAETLHDSFSSLLSAAVRLAEVEQGQEARRLVEWAKNTQRAKDIMRPHLKKARIRALVKLNVY